jgi:hypothetical protein
VLALDRRRALRWLEGFALALVIGLLPWPGLKSGWSRLWSGLANATVFQPDFGHGGRAQLRPAEQHERGTGDHVATDAVLALQVRNYQGDLQLGTSSRRDGYLPLLVLIAAVVAAPLGWKARLRLLAAGVPAALAIGLLLLRLAVAATFASRLRGVYPTDSLARSALAMAEQVLVMPPALRLAAPLLVALALVGYGLNRPAPTTVTAP